MIFFSCCYNIYDVEPSMECYESLAGTWGVLCGITDNKIYVYDSMFVCYVCMYVAYISSIIYSIFKCFVTRLYVKKNSLILYLSRNTAELLPFLRNVYSYTNPLHMKNHNNLLWIIFLPPEWRIIANVNDLLLNQDSSHPLEYTIRRR